MSEIAVSAGVADQHQRALRLFQEREYEEAARSWAEVLKIRESSEIWNDWATAKLMQGEIEKSEAGYRRALELDPANSRAWGNLGALLAAAGRFSEAVPLFEHAANGSSGAERERLLGIAESCRAQSPAGSVANSLPVTRHLTEIAKVIHIQSQMIASLTHRLSVLEGNLVRSGSASGSRSGRAAPALEGSPATANSGEPDAAGLSQGSVHLPDGNVRRQDQTQTFPHGPHGPNGKGASRATSAKICPAPREAPQPGVYFNGAVYGGSGYAEEGWMAALGLAQHHIPVQLVPVGKTADREKIIPEDCRKQLESLQRQLVDIPRSVIFQNCAASGWNLQRAGRLSVGRTMFETDRVPDSFLEACAAMDEVWVPSRFNMETFAQSGVDKCKLRLVPGGVDTRTFCPGAEPLEIPHKRSFNFLSVFDWLRRKGHDILLRAYLEEFTAEDDVALILKIYQLAGAGGDVEARISHFIERTARLSMEKAPVIILLNGFIPQSQLARLYATANAFVLPSRGEGYGRPYLEAMACRLPVIATNWSGQLDFLNPGNSYLVDARLAPVPADVEIEDYQGHLWAEPDVEHLRKLMREVYSRPEEAQKRAEQGFRDAVREYGWSMVIPQWVSQFQRLLG